MPLVWVTGNSGVGKSTVCALLRDRGEVAIDADWDGYNHWVDRTSGAPVVDPLYPAPPGWLDRHAWRIKRGDVEVLAARTSGQAFLCGYVENEADVLDLLDQVICLVADDERLRERLLSRTSNAFGKNPEELAAMLRHNAGIEAAYRRRGAAIIDATAPPEDVVDAILAQTQ